MLVQCSVKVQYGIILLSSDIKTSVLSVIFLHSLYFKFEEFHGRVSKDLDKNKSMIGFSHCLFFSVLPSLQVPHVSCLNTLSLLFEKLSL